MFKNHIRFAVRLFLKERIYSILNIMGLALGITIGMILLLFLQSELTYDQHYSKYDQIYRFTNHLTAPGADFNTARSSQKIGSILKDELPEVIEYVRFVGVGTPLITVDDDPDTAPLDETVCRDTDSDGCDDCSSGSDDPANDGTDTDQDGACDLGDTDDDNDGVIDDEDTDSLNEFICSDTDEDTCDDCSLGQFDLDNDGADYDGDGLCDDGDVDFADCDVYDGSGFDEIECEKVRASSPRNSYPDNISRSPARESLRLGL